MGEAGSFSPINFSILPPKSTTFSLAGSDGGQDLAPGGHLDTAGVSPGIKDLPLLGREAGSHWSVGCTVGEFGTRLE
jgi:hypothetical protein